MPDTARESIVGQGDFRYRPQPDWPQLPAGWDLKEVVAVDTDETGRVFVFCRGEHPVIVLDDSGRFLNSWGEGCFARPHGLIVAADGSVWCADDFGHAIYQFTPDGELLTTLGTPGQPSATGAADFDYRTIAQAAGPFNAPTNTALSPAGEIYVADGYCNARVHRFSAAGELLNSWGEPGSAPGQFHVVHDVGVAADGTVFVCDRENSRLQLFSPVGEPLGEWTDVARPCNVAFDAAGNVYVSELGFVIGKFPGDEFPRHQQVPSRVSIFSPGGVLQARFGSGEYGAAGHFFAAHGIGVSPRGDVYVGEVRPYHFGAHSRSDAPRAPSTAPVLQKLVRVD